MPSLGPGDHGESGSPPSPAGSMEGVQISKRLLLINSISNVVRRILSITILFWLYQRLVLMVPVEELALLPLLMALINIVPIFVTILQGGLGRYLTEAYAQKDAERVTQVVSSMLPFLWGASLLVAVLGTAFILHIERFLDIEPRYVGLAQAMFAILIFGMVVRIAVQPLSMGFYLRQRLIHRDLIGLGAELLKMLLLVVLLTQVSTTVLWVVVAIVGSSLAELAVVVTLSRRLVPALRFRISQFRREVLRPVLTFGGWTILGQLSTLLREAADPWILFKFAGPGEVVTFTFGNQPDRQIRRMVFSATATAQPATTAMYATGQSERLRTTWLRMTRYSVWVLLSLTLPLMIFREEFFRLYLKGQFEEHAEVTTVMLLLLARYIAISPNAIVGLLAIARADMHPAAWRALFVETTNVLLTLGLVAFADMGAIGAALSTLLVHGVLHPTLNWPLGLRYAGVGVGEWLLRSMLPGIVPALVAAPVWIACNLWLEPDTWFLLGLAAVLGFVAYGVALWYSLPREDRGDALQAVRGMAKRFRPSGSDSVR